MELADLHFAFINDLFKAGSEYISRLEEEKAKRRPAKKLGGAAPPEKKQKTKASRG